MRNRYGDRILSAVVGNTNSGESAFKTDGNNIFLITYIILVESSFFIILCIDFISLLVFNLDT